MRRAAMIELLEAAAKISQQGGKHFHFGMVFARGGAEREQALFSRVQASRVKIEAVLRFGQRRLSFRRFDRCLPERCDRHFHMAAHLFLNMFERPSGRAQPCRRRMFTGDYLPGIGHRL